MEDNIPQLEVGIKIKILLQKKLEENQFYKTYYSCYELTFIFLEEFLKDLEKAKILFKTILLGTFFKSSFEL